MMPSLLKYHPKIQPFYNTLHHFTLHWLHFKANIYNKHLYNIDLINNSLKYIKFNNNILFN